MLEPTREQIKEAFKKTIERWERIVEDVDYFSESDCDLCLLEGTKEDYVCSQLCPVSLYGEKSHCHGTPYSNFFHVRTTENALAELNFLRKVYIWWTEKGANKILDKVAMYGKQEKKEEWVDVTNELSWEFRKEAMGIGFGVLSMYYKQTLIGHLCADGGFSFVDQRFKKERSGVWFRILKKIKSLDHAGI